MQKFNKLKSIPAYLPIVNIDTDMIIPKQFLKTIKRTGLGKNLFFEMRYDDQGKEVNDFALNQSPFNNSKILIAGKNFGSFKLIKISSFLFEYSESSFIFSSSKIIGRIPFLKQLL